MVLTIGEKGHAAVFGVGFVGGVRGGGKKKTSRKRGNRENHYRARSSRTKDDRAYEAVSGPEEKEKRKREKCHILGKGS